MPRFENSDSLRLVEVRHSGRCGSEAAHLTLVPRGTAGPNATSEDTSPDLGHRPVIIAGRRSSTIGAPGVLDDADFARTLASADPAAIFAVLDVAS